MLNPSFGASDLLYSIDKSRQAAVQHLISRLSIVSEGVLSFLLKLYQLHLTIAEDRSFITICVSTFIFVCVNPSMLCSSLISLGGCTFVLVYAAVMS